MAAPAVGQLKDQEKAGAAAAANSSLKYQVCATVTDYCAVARALPLHQVLFDLHNASCQERRQVIERKTPTLPKGPLYRNVGIAGYHLIDWTEGHPSPRTRNTAKIEISRTATTLAASGWLEKASCSKGPSGEVLVEDTFWQARVVPEVQFVEDVEHQEPPVTVDLVPPKTTAVLRLSALCADDREESLQYSVTPIVDGVAQSSIYTSPVLRAGKAGIESDASLGAVSIHSYWSPQSLKGKTELRLTILQFGGRSSGRSRAENEKADHVPAP
jgi:hypothetical protein